MATRVNEIDDDRPPREKRRDEVAAPVAFPSRRVPEELIEGVIERALERQREALEILARR